MPRLTAPFLRTVSCARVRSRTHTRVRKLRIRAYTRYADSERERTSERKPRPSRETRGRGGSRARDFRDRILAIIYASRAYGFRLYGAYECLSAKINGQFVRAHCRR